MRKLMLALSMATMVACNADAPPADTSSAQTQPPVSEAVAPAPSPTPAMPADSTKPAFVDRVWRTVDGSAVEAGTTYIFFDNGTLQIDSPNGTPMTGSWDYRNQQLTMVEQGVSYPVDIVRLDNNRFTIRSNNPGGSVVIEMAAAPELSVPELQ